MSLLVPNFSCWTCFLAIDSLGFHLKCCCRVIECKNLPHQGVELDLQRCLFLCNIVPSLLKYEWIFFFPAGEYRTRIFICKVKFSSDTLTGGCSSLRKAKLSMFPCWLQNMLHCFWDLCGFLFFLQRFLLLFSPRTRWLVGACSSWLRL